MNGCRKRDTSGRGREPRGATLAEMLVVATILLLLAGLVVPCVGSVIAYVHAAVCCQRLRNLAAAVHACRAEEGTPTPPPAETWADWLQSKIIDDQTYCCPDDDNPLERAFGKDQIYLRICSGSTFLYDIYLFAEQTVYQTPYGPRSVVERRNVSPDGRTYDLYIEDLTPSRADWDWDVRMHIEEGNKELRATILRGSSAGYSHYLYRGKQKLLEDPVKSYEAQGTQLLLSHLLPGSYGMNNQLSATPPGRQLLLLDYERWVADHDGKGNQDDDLSEMLAPRHLGRLNIATFDGAVRGVAPESLTEDDSLWTGEVEP
jgi:prepilin-type processing-associated H-X9-DG protein